MVREWMLRPPVRHDRAFIRDLRRTIPRRRRAHRSE